MTFVDDLVRGRSSATAAPLSPTQPARHQGLLLSGTWSADIFRLTIAECFLFPGATIPIALWSVNVVMLLNFIPADWSVESNVALTSVSFQHLKSRDTTPSHLISQRSTANVPAPWLIPER
jgi:hypothetical protein